MLREEQSLRCRREEKVDFYTGETIAHDTAHATSTVALPPQPTQVRAPRTEMSLRAAKHPLWPALSDLVKCRRHGWEFAGAPGTKIGPRRLAKREALLASCGGIP